MFASTVVLAGSHVSAADGDKQPNAQQTPEQSGEQSGEEQPEQASEAPAFRTDGGDESLPWYALKEGEFPPEGSAHYFAGELIKVDHLRRSFVLRNDRTDSQRRSHFDLPVAAAMLPYGSVSYHGSPAALVDIPLGTHLHGWFYKRDPDDNSVVVEGWHNRKSIDVDFTRCIRLVDDFTYRVQRKEAWRVDSVDLPAMKFSATLLSDGKETEQTATYDLMPATRVWKGREIRELSDIRPGQTVQVNLTWATLYGPGRVREIWLDQESQDLATAHQLRKHQLHIRERGAAGWVDAVDNKTRELTITFFGGVDPPLFDDFKKDDSVGVAVALPTLMTHDPVNDRRRGPVLEIRSVEKQQGSSGVQIRVRPDLLLEGYRPKHIVRVYAAGWKVIALPKEEEFFGYE